MRLRLRLRLRLRVQAMALVSRSSALITTVAAELRRVREAHMLWRRAARNVLQFVLHGTAVSGADASEALLGAEQDAEIRRFTR